MSKTTKDALERVGATVVCAALGALLVWFAAGAPTTRTAILVGATAVVTALLDVLKVVWASLLKSTTGASFVNLDN